MHPFQAASSPGAVAIEGVEDDLLESGRPIAEITSRTTAAAGVVARLAERHRERLASKGAVPIAEVKEDIRERRWPRITANAGAPVRRAAEIGETAL